MYTLRARILTPESQQRACLLQDGLIVIDDEGRISEVCDYDGQAYDEHLNGGVLVPGFVDGHLHFPQTRIIGAASGPLLQWLENSTFPEEAKFANADHARTVAQMFCRALASAGTTLSFIYGSVHTQATHLLAQELASTGLRAILGPVLMDEHCPADLRIPTPQAMAGLEELMERWHRFDERLQIAVIPRFALSCSKEMLNAAGEFAQRHELWVSTHLAETVSEGELAKERFSAPDYLSIYEDAGLAHSRSVFAHCIHLSSEEWERLSQAGCVVAHCPDSNFFLGSGRMPLDRLQEHKIAMVMGTDVAAGRTFRIPRVLSSAYDNALALPGRLQLDPQELLWWGTHGAALALGHPHLGKIQPGFDADMVWLDVPTWADDLASILGWILFHNDAPRAKRTWVRGQQIWDIRKEGIEPKLF